MNIEISFYTDGPLIWRRK